MVKIKLIFELYIFKPNSSNNIPTYVIFLSILRYQTHVNSINEIKTLNIILTNKNDYHIKH
jgi:hypothetical protein